MKHVSISLPEALADEAAKAGLLAPARLEALLRAELRQQQISSLFEAMNSMASEADEPALSAEEVAEEIASMRRERRSGIAH